MLSAMYRANGAMYGIIDQLKMNVSYLGGFILKTKVPPIYLMPKLLFWTGNWGQKFLLRHPWEPAPEAKLLPHLRSGCSGFCSCERLGVLRIPMRQVLSCPQNAQRNPIERYLDPGVLETPPTPLARKQIWDIMISQTGNAGSQMRMNIYIYLHKLGPRP